MRPVRWLCGFGALLLTLTLSGHASGGVRAAQDQPGLLDELIASLTPEERIGQVVMVNFVGTDVSSGSLIGSLILEHHVGSVLISASNGNVINSGDTAAQVATLTNGLQERAYEATARTIGGREVFIPLFIATDNEGDFFPFTNISHNLTPIPSAMTVGATWSKAHAEDVGGILGKELALVGVNMLLGPVADVLDSPRSGGNGDIGTRSFGGNPLWVGALGRAYVRGVHEGGKGRVLTVAKHFPGHGGSDRSPDSEVATVNKDLDELRRSELVPFATLTSDLEDDPLGRTDALMTSHIRYRGFQAVGPFTRPISLDSQGMQAAMALPEFASWRADGLVVSDSLGVLAVKKWYDPTLQSFPNRQIARDALLAGNDVLPLVEFSLERGWAEYQVPTIIDTIEFMVEQYGSDPLFRARADDALRRVLAHKLELYPEPTLETVRVDPAAASTGVGLQRAAMASLARDALTLISPTAEELRLRMPRGPQRGERIVIVECWADCYPFRVLPQDEIAGAILTLYGPDGTGAVNPEDLTTLSFGDLMGWLDRALEPEDDKRVSDAVFQADWIVFALADYNPNAYPASGAVKRFLDSAPLDVRSKRLVAIAYNAPYHLDSTQIGKLTAYFGIYSKTPEAIEASVRGLFRELTPHGASPVSITGVGYDLATAVQPDPAQRITLTTGDGGQPGAPVTITTSRIVDRNGYPVPDGTEVVFTVTGAGGENATSRAVATDGVATVTLSPAPGTYEVRARVGAVTSEALAVELAAPGGDTPPPAAEGTSGSGGRPPLGLILGAGVPAGLALAAAAGSVAIAARRRRRAPEPGEAQPAVPSRGIRVDERTHRVWVEGREIAPPMSAEQYRLLSYLYANEGRVCSREELVAHIWPDAHAEGISEEALDALVRRLRDRLAQAGATRPYVITLRGHGFRLDL